MIIISLSACWAVCPQETEVFHTAFENIFALLNSGNIFAIKWFIMKLRIRGREFKTMNIMRDD